MPEDTPLGDAVMVGGTRVPIELLDPAFAGIDGPELEAAIAAAVAEHSSYLPVDGWRVFEDAEGCIVVGSDGLTGGQWSTITLTRTQSGLVEHGITFCQTPSRTPEDRGRGLAMSFVEDPLIMKAGTKPSVQVRITNDTYEAVERNSLGPAFGTVADSAGQPIVHDPGPYGVALVGYRIHVRPQRSVDYNVWFLGCDLHQLAPGDYELRATLHELALTATGRLEVI